MTAKYALMFKLITRFVFISFVGKWFTKTIIIGYFFFIFYETRGLNKLCSW